MQHKECSGMNKVNEDKVLKYMRQTKQTKLIFVYDEDYYFASVSVDSSSRYPDDYHSLNIEEIPMPIKFMGLEE